MAETGISGGRASVARHETGEIRRGEVVEGGGRRSDGGGGGSGDKAVRHNLGLNAEVEDRRGGGVRHDAAGCSGMTG